MLEFDYKSVSNGSGSNALSLPLELEHAIIDHLHVENDKLTLSACSIVCHAWHERSRRRLFHTLFIRKGVVFRSFNDEGFPIDKHTEYNQSATFVNRFIEFLQYISTAPEIHKYVEHLVLIGYIAQSRAGRNSLAISTLAKILSYLPNVLSLEAHNIQIFGELIESQPSKSPHPTDLLRPLSRLRLVNSGDIIAFLQPFSEIKVLHLETTPVEDLISGFEGKLETRIYSIHSPFVKTMVIIVNHFRQSSYGHFTSLNLSACSSVQDLTTFGKVISHVSGTLESLGLDVSLIPVVLHSMPNCWGLLSLESCSRLSSIRISIGTGAAHKSHPEHSLSRCIIRILEIPSHTPGSLRSFTLQIIVSASSGIFITNYDIPWEHVEAKLQELSGLREFTFEFAETEDVQGINSLEDYERMVEQNLPSYRHDKYLKIRVRRVAQNDMYALGSR